MKPRKIQKKPIAQAKQKAVTAKKPVRRSLEKQVFQPSVGLHLLKPPKGSHKRRKYLGRGSSSGHGKTSTRAARDRLPAQEGIFIWVLKAVKPL